MPKAVHAQFTSGYGRRPVDENVEQRRLPPSDRPDAAPHARRAVRAAGQAATALGGWGPECGLLVSSGGVFRSRR